MENAWMPKVAGILDIVAGSFGVFLSFLIFLWFAVFYYFLPTNSLEFNELPKELVVIFMAFWAIFILVAGVLAIVGGTRALRKKTWGLALTGSIAAFFGSSPLGVAAIIFTVLSKSQFE